MNKIHHRKNIRLKGYNYSKPDSYFVTICTKDRKCLFGENVDEELFLNQMGKIVEKYWLEIPMHFPNVVYDEFVIMPNHIHGIIVITNDDNPVGSILELTLQELYDRKQRRLMTLPKIVGRFKMNSAKQINIIRNLPRKPVWQRNYYEHIFRDEASLNRIRNYIRDNPKNWKEDNHR